MSENKIGSDLWNIPPSLAFKAVKAMIGHQDFASFNTHLSHDKLKALQEASNVQELCIDEPYVHSFGISVDYAKEGYYAQYKASAAFISDSEFKLIVNKKCHHLACLAGCTP